MNVLQPAVSSAGPIRVPPEPVDPATDLSAFQDMLARELRDDWRPDEWDNGTWVFTGHPGHLGTLVEICRFPGCEGPSFTRSSGLCNVCTGRYDRHTKRLGAMSSEDWINRAAELQRTNWAAEIVPILCSVTNCTNRSKGLGVPLMAATDGNPKRWHQKKERLPPLCTGHHPHRTPEDIGAWISAQTQRPVAAPEYCAVPWCGYKRHHANNIGICRLHARLITTPGELALHIQREAVVALEPDGFREIYAPPARPGGYQLDFGPLRRRYPGLATELLWSLQRQDRIGFPVNVVTTRSLIASAMNFPPAAQSFLNADTRALDEGRVLRSANAASMFRVVRARLLERYVPWSTQGDVLRSDLIPFSLLTTSSNRSGSARSMAALDFRPIPLDWARHMTKLWILERSTTESSPTTLITHVARLCTGFLVHCSARHLAPPTAAADLTREHGKLLAQALADMTRADGKPFTTGYKRFLGSVVAGMIDYARKNSDLFEHTSLSFALDYDLKIPVEQSSGADADDETGRAIPEPVIEYLFTKLPDAHVASPVSAAVPNAVYKAAFTCYMSLLRDAGRRPGETAGLQRDCLSYDGTGQATLLWHNDKGRRRGRRLPIWAETAQALETWFTIRDRHVATMPSGQQDWLFPTFRARARDKHLKTSWFNQRLRNWINNRLPDLPGPPTGPGAGTPFAKSAVFAYAFRHSYCQRLADAGIAQETLRRLMDHRSADTTARYYTVTNARKRKAIESVKRLSFDPAGAHAPVEEELYSMAAVAVPFGNCTEPTNIKAGGKACPARFQCGGCTFFRSDPSHLPDLNAHLDRMKEDLAWQIAQNARPSLITDTQAEIDALTALVHAQEDRLADLPSAERDALNEAAGVLRRLRANIPTAIDKPFIPVGSLKIRSNAVKESE
ncbi:tyrosine-type recombinase/integrase [Pseudarthrobacter oxydans]|uniref:tyrosine-type recombinase/integrase n=1 Tax=Pseudarthrobacter oxydans TaxID=1671 RepID=UPI00344F39D5